jgi:3D (Asp-Asp-Asp) domain-containing protein
MHRRSLNPSEHWELFTLLAILVVAGVFVTMFWHLDRIPNMFASTTNTAPAPMLAVTPNPQTNQTTLIPGGQSTVNSTPILEKPVIVPPIQQTDSFIFNGRKYVYWETLTLRVTSYAPDAACCWPYDGTTTASGRSVSTNGGHLVAADTSLIPFNYMVRVPSYDHGKPVPVLDRGQAIRGYRLDVLLPTFSQAQDWGIKFLSVRIYRPVDE